MTEARPRHRVLRALPLAAFAGTVALVACSLADTGRDSTGADARVTREVVDGSEVVTRDNGDGTGTVTVGPRPGSDTLGTPGFSWEYRFDPPLQITPGSPPPPPNVYPVVEDVAAGSPAAAAGLRDGDVILSSNGVDGKVTPLMPDSRPGSAYAFHVRRGREELDLRLVLGPSAARLRRTRAR